MAHFLDNDGLIYVWSKIKSFVTGITNNKVDKVSGKGLSTNDYTTAEKNKLSGIATGAEVNQNAYSIVTTDGMLVPAQSKTATLKLKSGANITLTGNPNTSEVTIDADVQNYAVFPPATSSSDGGIGLVPKPVKGKQNSYLRGDGTWEVPPNTTYLPATITTDGLMKASDKAKLDNLDKPATQNMNGLMAAADKKKLDGFGQASDYALKADLTKVYKQKGNVATYNDLTNLMSTAEPGDVYNVLSDGMNYVFTENRTWDALGATFSVDPITNAEIDAVCV